MGQTHRLAGNPPRPRPARGAGYRQRPGIWRFVIPAPGHRREYFMPPAGLLTDNPQANPAIEEAPMLRKILLVFCLLPLANLALADAPAVGSAAPAFKLQDQN